VSRKPSAITCTVAPESTTPRSAVAACGTRGRRSRRPWASAGDPDDGVVAWSEDGRRAGWWHWSRRPVDPTSGGPEASNPVPVGGKGRSPSRTALETREADGPAGRRRQRRWRRVRAGECRSAPCTAPRRSTRVLDEPRSARIVRDQADHAGPGPCREREAADRAGGPTIDVSGPFVEDHCRSPVTGFRRRL
jgi:hypothetical protein